MRVVRYWPSVGRRPGVARNRWALIVGSDGQPLGDVSRVYEGMWVCAEDGQSTTVTNLRAAVSWLNQRRRWQQRRESRRPHA